MKLSWILLFATLPILACQKEYQEQPAPSAEPPPPVLYPTDPEVIYEVNLRAFSLAGDLKGVSARLGELEKLDVRTLWLMPIYPIGKVKSVNSPYCVKDYKAVAAEYGTLKDLRSLVSSCHQKGIKVILDWVANHTAWDHNWIKEHPDWYSQDANGTIISPPGTNWQDVADLNFEVPAMRIAMIDAMQYWLDSADIDGFRCDYADGVPFDFWQEAIGKFRAQSNKDLLFLAEGDRGDHFKAGFDLNFGWRFYGALKKAFEQGKPDLIWQSIQSEAQRIPRAKGQLRFTTNHDFSAWHESPVTAFKGKQAALAAFAAILFSGEIPLIYTGQETGRSATTAFFSQDPINWLADTAYTHRYERLMTLHRDLKADSILLRHHPDRFSLIIDYANSKQSALIAINLRNFLAELSLPSEWQGRQVINRLQDTVGQFKERVLLPPHGVAIFQNHP